jgi:hypothetical protein
MAGRSGDTFKKRQKEVARAEKHREKLARRMERKQNKQNPDSELGQAAGDAPEKAADSPEAGPILSQPDNGGSRLY